MARSSDASFPMSLFRDKTFQLRMIRRIMLMTSLFILQSTIVLGIFYYMFLGNLVAGNAPLMFASEDMGGIGEAIPSMSSVIGWWLLAMLAINGAVTACIAVYVLRKLGNPILAIKRALNEIGDGNLGVRLRAGDSREFNELYVALNRALEQIHGKINEARTLTKVIDQLDDQPRPDEQKVREAMQRCGEVLKFFDVDAAAGNDDSNEGNGKDKRHHNRS